MTEPINKRARQKMKRDAKRLAKQSEQPAAPKFIMGGCSSNLKGVSEDFWQNLDNFAIAAFTGAIIIPEPVKQKEPERPRYTTEPPNKLRVFASWLCNKVAGIKRPAEHLNTDEIKTN